MAEDFGERLPYMLRMVGTAVSQELERTLRDFSLTHAQLAALAQLGLEHPEGLSGAQLGHRAGVKPQSMSTAIASLLDRGLVDRTSHPTHGRILEVRITPAGIKLLARAQVATKQAEERATWMLSAEQREQLRELLTLMMRALGLYLPR